MSDQNDVTTEASLPDELTLLKQRATKVGMKWHPNIKLDTLKKNLDAFLNPPEVTKEEVVPVKEATKAPVNLDANVAPAELLLRKRNMTGHQEKMFVLDQKRKAANRLVRVRVTNMNINKKEHKGEIFTVSNSVVGTIKKFVQFNSQDGWHVPQLILTAMQERMCQVFYNTTDHKGRKIKKGKLINEFAIEILPPLSKSELEDLATKQALSQNID